MSVMFLPLRLIPMPVQAVVLATVLDLFLSRDDRLRPLIQSLEGRVYHIHVRDMGNDFHLGFSHGRPWVHPAGGEQADVRINATSAGFARLCFAREDPDDLVFQRVLTLSGDSEAMLRFKKLMLAADIDWERELRSAFGDYFGRRVATAARTLLEAEARLGETARASANACLHAMDMPSEERLQVWQAGVEDAARKLKRLQTRTKRIVNAISARQGRGRGAKD